MLKRSLFFSKPYRLNTKDRQLVIKTEEGEVVKTIPIEDIGFVVLEDPRITLTQRLLHRFAENNVSVVICDEKFMPSSILLNLNTNYVQSERYANQIKASEPLKKNLWQQTIKAKISNQAKVLEMAGKDPGMLPSLAKRVQSGDAGNFEAIAARQYWQELFGPEFSRERYGTKPNDALNYGYAIIRAAMARALTGSGLLPAIGIFHRNKYNAFCLADDIMEPYRPFVDWLVWQLYQEVGNDLEVNTPVKLKLVELLASDTLSGGNLSPMMIAKTTTTASLVKCFEGSSRKLNYPEFPPP